MQNPEAECVVSAWGKGADVKKFMHQTFQRVCSLAVCGGCLGLAAASAAARQQAVELWPTATEMPVDNGWDYEDEALGPPDCPDCTVGTSGCVAKEEASFPTHDYMKLRAFRTSGGRTKTSRAALRFPPR